MSRRTLAAVLVPVALLASCASPKHRSATPTTTPATATPTTPAAVTTGPAVTPTGPVDVYAHDLAGMLSPVVAGMPDRVYVPNSVSNTVDVIDPVTFAIVGHFPVGRLPQHVTPSWDLKTLYVDNDEGNSLTPIDPRTGKAGRPIPVTDPYNLYFTPDGSKALVIAERLRRIDVRDPHTWRLIQSVPVPYAGVDHADYTADGNEMVLSCEFSGWVVRLDLRTMTLTGKVSVGGTPVDVKLSPDGSVFYVANMDRGGVSVLDAKTLRQLRFVPTGKGAHGLYVSRDNRSLYVTNRMAGSISVIDFKTGRVAKTWRIGGSPDMGGVSSDGSRLWVSGRYDGVVYVIDTRTGRLVRTIKVGNGPHGLAVYPQPGRYSLGHTGVFR
jgi:YVTN family beta-propeller protein